MGIPDGNMPGPLEGNTLEKWDGTELGKPEDTTLGKCGGAKQGGIPTGARLTMGADGSTKRSKQPSDTIDQAKEEPAAKEGKVAQECRKHERKRCGRGMAQTDGVVEGLDHGVAPGAESSKGDQRSNHKVLRSKTSPDTAPNQAPNNHQMHRSKANEWNHDQMVVKEVLRSKGLRQGVEA